MLLGFPLDYQTDFYINQAVSEFGLLSVWHNHRGNKYRVLVKVWLVHPKFVPKSFVMRQLVGARNSWTFPVYLLCSNDWNAHIHPTPPPDEDPEPDNRNPHPFYGNFMTAEQIFQQQVANWLQQNGANVPIHNHGPNNHNNHRSEERRVGKECRL